MDNKRWYAVQLESTDPWNNGSYDLDEAIEMLREQGSGLIAVINEETQFCEDELTYEDLIDEDPDLLDKNGNAVKVGDWVMDGDGTYEIGEINYRSGRQVTYREVLPEEDGDGYYLDEQEGYLTFAEVAHKEKI